MASFRDKQKNNPLKPMPVAIPQVDPMSSLTEYKPIVAEEPKATVAPEKKSTAQPKVKKGSTTPKPKALPNEADETEEMVVLFAKIPKSMKQWVDIYKITTEQELGDIVEEAITLLQKKVGNG